MIEIVARTVCPTCGGSGELRCSDAVGISQELMDICVDKTCDTCHGDGTVPRVLATFADTAALRDAINAAINRDLGLDSCEDDEWNNTSAEVPAALGVSDDQG